VSEYLI
jgi:hypothetical protein